MKKSDPTITITDSRIEIIESVSVPETIIACNDDWGRAAAHNKVLTRSDVLRLLGGTLGDVEDVYVMTDECIRMNPSYMDAGAMALLNPIERVAIAEAESDMRLDFPCTSLDLYDWWVRNGREVYLNECFVEDIEKIAGQPEACLVVNSEIEEKGRRILKRNQIMRETETRLLIHALLDEFEKIHKRTPHCKEVWAYLLSGKFTHELLEDIQHEVVILDNRKRMDWRCFDRIFKNIYSVKGNGN